MATQDAQPLVHTDTQAFPAPYLAKHSALSAQKDLDGNALNHQTYTPTCGYSTLRPPDQEGVGLYCFNNDLPYSSPPTSAAVWQV